jgi:hypothetical protein
MMSEAIRGNGPRGRVVVEGISRSPTLTIQYFRNPDDTIIIIISIPASAIAKADKHNPPSGHTPHDII